jgi:hypothetical protein
VSTLDQDLSGQIEALKASGATTIYREKISGVRAVRPQLAKLMTALKPGDVVMVTKLDRLGPSTRVDHDETNGRRGVRLGARRRAQSTRSAGFDFSVRYVLDVVDRLVQDGEAFFFVIALIELDSTAA